VQVRFSNSHSKFFLKKILLTGATGFVGKKILSALNEANVSIIPVVRSGKEAQLDGFTKVKKIVSSPNIFIESIDWWHKQCEGIDTIIHSAWYTEPGKYLESSQNIECLIGSLNLAQGAVLAGVKKFVGIGTCFEYDLNCRVLSKNTPLNPSTLYAGTKCSLFTGLSHYLSNKKIDFAWCRLFYLYGEGEDERRLVPFLHKQLSNGNPVELTSGNQIRDFLDVTVAGERIVKIALSKLKGPINICSGSPITVKQIAEMIADQYGRRDLLKFGLRQDNLVDPPCVLGITEHF
jgi:nucleoside-diphosphate-sugar epimerase